MKIHIFLWFLESRIYVTNLTAHFSSKKWKRVSKFYFYISMSFSFTSISNPGPSTQNVKSHQKICISYSLSLPLVGEINSPFLEDKNLICWESGDRFCTNGWWVYWWCWSIHSSPTLYWFVYCLPFLWDSQPPKGSNKAYLISLWHIAGISICICWMYH